MSQLKKFFFNNKFLSFVLLLYVGLFIFKAPSALKALQNSSYYFKEMAIIMPVIMLLTALLEAWVPKKTIENSLGENAGFKGSVFSFLLGSFSAGPIYAAFPVCITLLKKGASTSNIVILLSTWAVVKIPMLANEAKFLSPLFMATRWILTTISIFLIGYITAKFVKRKEILAIHELDNKDTQKLTINSSYCIGCGLCAKLYPEVFQMKNKKAVCIDTKVTLKSICAIVDQCPANAIITPNVMQEK